MTEDAQMTPTMTAAVLHGARDLRLEDVPVPIAGEGEVLLSVDGVGLCGSDVHYYLDGRNGSNVVRKPAILGHEIAGTVVETGPGVSPQLLGRRVVVEPAESCGQCAQCTAGRYNLCEAGRCLGSPPTHGGLARHVVAPADLVHVLPDGLDRVAGPLVEPLAVAVHAMNRAGVAAGRDVLVSGGGPVGLLVAQVARRRGARSVTVVDPVPERLQVARNLGFELAVTPDQVDGLFDAVLECSGAPAALGAALRSARPGGKLVMVGTPPAGEVAVPLGLVQRYEVDVVGCFRYTHAFPEAVSLAASGEVELTRLVTARFPLRDAREALVHAASGQGVKTVVEPAQEGESA
jgi:L-iditol 2-dehydrogenase